MDPKYVITWSLVSIFVLVLIDSVASDLAQDKEKCTNPLIALGTCLPYVSGDAKTPPPDCCSGLKEVMVKSKECVCIFIKDRNDPSFGIKVNVTQALNLPLKCHSPNPNLSECPVEIVKSSRVIIDSSPMITLTSQVLSGSSQILKLSSKLYRVEYYPACYLIESVTGAPVSPRLLARTKPFYTCLKIRPMPKSFRSSPGLFKETIVALRILLLQMQAKKEQLQLK